MGVNTDRITSGLRSVVSDVPVMYQVRFGCDWSICADSGMGAVTRRQGLAMSTPPDVCPSPTGWP